MEPITILFLLSSGICLMFSKEKAVRLGGVCLMAVGLFEAQKHIDIIPMVELLIILLFITLAFFVIVKPSRLGTRIVKNS